MRHARRDARDSEGGETSGRGAEQNQGFLHRRRRRAARRSARAPFVTRLRVSEPIALAVHVENMDMLRDAIEQRAGRTLIAEYPRSHVDGQIGNLNHCRPLVALVEHLEPRFRSELRGQHGLGRRRFGTAAPRRNADRYPRCRRRACGVWRAGRGGHITRQLSVAPAIDSHVWTRASPLDRATRIHRRPVGRHGAPGDNLLTGAPQSDSSAFPGDRQGLSGL